jgi:hypothetical protein
MDDGNDVRRRARNAKPEAPTAKMREILRLSTDIGAIRPLSTSSSGTMAATPAAGRSPAAEQAAGERPATVQHETTARQSEHEPRRSCRGRPVEG